MEIPSGTGGTAYRTPTASAELADLVQFRGRDEVEAYLEEHPELLPLLREARTVIPRNFGPDAPVVSEVFTDPEAEEEHGELYGQIRSPLPPDEPLRRLRQLDDGWWLEALGTADGNLTISVEPR